MKIDACRRIAVAVAITGIFGLVALLGGPGYVGTAEAAPGCPSGSMMNIVAHQDDDLFFMNPNLLHDIQAGRCVRTIYITAGDAGDVQSYWSSRESGVKAAYAKMAGVVNAWTTADAGVTGHPITVATLTARPSITLAFMRLPDGNLDGSGFPRTGQTSLARLESGAISSIRAVDGSSSYSKATLISTLLALINGYQPTALNTQDYVNVDDGDHSDHHAAARFVQQANAQYTAAHTFAGYQGYPISNRPENVTGPDLTAKVNAFTTYAAFDPKTCQTEAACSGRPEEEWWHRQYVVAGDGTTTPPPTTTTPPPTTTTPPGAGSNVALSATATASSENVAAGQGAAKAIDGVLGGYPGDSSKEWSTQGGKAGSWIQLTWASPVTVNQVVLHDRPNIDDQVLAGTLTFSDGSSVAVGALDNGGAATPVSFSSRTVTSVRLTITTVSPGTVGIGLSEFQVLSTTAPPVTTTTAPPPVTTTTAPPPVTTTAPPPATTTTPPGAGSNVALSATATASSENLADGQGAAKAIDGVLGGYPGDSSKEWSTQGGKAGSWIQLTWPSAQTVGQVVLHDRPNIDDQVLAGTLTFSDGSSVPVGALDNGGAATPVSFSSRTVTSVRLTITTVSPGTVGIGLSEFQVLSTTAPPVTTTTAPPPVTTTTAPPPVTTTAPPPATTTTPPGAGSNVALSATATASSENLADGQGAAKAIDGVLGGYPGDSSKEWSTQGGKAGSWIQLTWPSAQTVGQVVLHDRPNIDDQVLAGTLTFSDGSSVAVGALDNGGAATPVSFSSRTVTSVRLTITTVSPGTVGIGLSEFQVLSTTAPPVTTTTAPPPVTTTTAPPPVTTTAPPPATTTTPPGAGSNVALSATATASSENLADGQGAAKAIDGVLGGYPGDSSKEWSTQGGKAGSWIQLTWPSAQTVGQVVLHDRPNIDDQVLAGTLTFSDGSSVPVGALDNAGGPTTVSFSSRTVTSVRLTITTVSPGTLGVGLSEFQVKSA